MARPITNAFEYIRRKAGAANKRSKANIQYETYWGLYCNKFLK